MPPLKAQWAFIPGPQPTGGPEDRAPNPAYLRVGLGWAVGLQSTRLVLSFPLTTTINHIVLYDLIYFVDSNTFNCSLFYIYKCEVRLLVLPGNLDHTERTRNKRDI